MIDHKGQFANLAQDERNVNEIDRNEANEEESPSDYYYDDATGYEPYDSEAENDDVEESNYPEA